MKTSNQYTKIRSNILPLIFLAITMGISIQGKAQSESKNSLLQMINEDRTTVEAIAGYDEKTQSYIFQVAETPEVLNKVEELQKRSQNQFRAIIDNYDRDAQTAFYEMARYPNLISELVSYGKPSTSELNRIVSNYPADIHETAKKYSRMHFDVLIRIDRLNSEIDQAFQLYLEPYGPRTRESVNALLAYPEIVSILVEDKDFTTLLGEAFNEDPQWVKGNLNRISQELAEQNKEDMEAYKTQIQNDPEAYNEMLDASEKFARENNDVRYESPSESVVEVRVINSYPYWFGYPYWYSEPYWRPQPFYYHTGFYRNHYGNVVFVGLPSYHFMHWQTYNHPTLFPHLSYNYYSYYENHYMNRYRDSNRSIHHNRFYRSIESNVINNPRVNNSNLERIDHQRGTNIVRRPNTMESGSTRRGNSGITGQREYSNSRQGAGTSGTVNRRGNESINRGGNEQRSSNTRNGTVNRREYNTINPGRSEGSTNRRGSGTGSGTIRRESSPANANPGGTSAERSRQGASMNRSYNENPPLNQSSNSRVRQNASQSTTRRQPSSDNVGNRASSGRNASQVERSATPQRREASQSQRSATPQRREASQSQRSAAPQRREASQSQRSAAPQRREASQSQRSAAPERAARSENRAVSAQSSSRRQSQERSSSSPTVSSQNSKRENSNGRQR